MTKQIFGRDTVTGECGWFTPVADAPDVFIAGLTIAGDTITAVRSDGATFPVTITHPTPPAPTDPETDGVHLNGSVAPVIDLQAQTITYATLNDLDETPAAPLVQDISALIAALTSAPPPSVIGGSNVTVTTNANGDWVVSVPNPTVDTDTDLVNEFTANPDGSITATEVDINGNPTGNNFTFPAPVVDVDTIVDYCGNVLPATTPVLTRNDYKQRSVLITRLLAAGNVDLNDNHPALGLSTVEHATIDIFLPNNSCETLTYQLGVSIHADVNIGGGDEDTAVFAGQFTFINPAFLGNIHNGGGNNDYKIDSVDRSDLRFNAPPGGVTITLALQSVAVRVGLTDIGIIQNLAGYFFARSVETVA